MITLLEPPRPPGLPSGGFRYQERVVAALGDDASRISVPPAELHDKVRELRRQDPSAQVVVDGWFADLAADPLPDDVTALLHMAPARPDWSARPLHVVATGQPTADAIARQAASVTIVRPGVDACFSAAPRSGDPTFAIVCALATRATISVMLALTPSNRCLTSTAKSNRKLQSKRSLTLKLPTTAKGVTCRGFTQSRLTSQTLSKSHW